MTNNQDIKNLFNKGKLQEREPLGDDKKEIVSQCKEDINIISQEKWENENLAQLIFIKWPKRTDCYLADELLDHIKRSERMIIWKKNTDGRPIDNNTGRGYVPDQTSKEYITLYPLRNWVEVEGLKRAIHSSYRHFTAIKGDMVRLGNKDGTFGVSQKHAQEEEVIWDIVHLPKPNKSKKPKTPEPQSTSMSTISNPSQSQTDDDDDVEIILGPITSTTQMRGGCGVLGFLDLLGLGKWTISHITSSSWACF